MQNVKNMLVAGSAGRQMAVDICYENSEAPMPVVIYAHGFNGFKDWGNFDLIAAKFAAAGFVFIKFNFSHNGTTPAQPSDFTDLEAFGQNNYSIELHDLNAIIDWICSPLNNYHEILDTEKLSLIGHSMGGGIVLLQAASDNRVYKVVTWAGVSECKTPWGDWPAEKLMQWKEQGVQYYTNSRTHQQMPMHYQLYEDYQRNIDKLDVQKAISSLAIPVLLCHGTKDTAVPVAKAFQLKDWQPCAELFIIESDHVFDRTHPWPGNDLPNAMETVVQQTIDFLRG